jgi:NADPH:quinone reductase and related Zn-dependent oxidoreductases
MRAITLSGKGNGVKIIEVNKPSPGPEQLLIKVKSCGLNRSDLLETQGQDFGHIGGEEKILGSEYAGEIVEIGSNVKHFSVGQYVICRGGSGWAEFALAHPSRSMIFNPEILPWEQACCIQGNLQTMHDAIVTNGNFVKGQTIFIQGASSAVGIIGLQIARCLGA